MSFALLNSTVPRTLALAPMDGVTDHVYRDLFTARARPGALAFVVSEFIRVTDRPIPASVIERGCPEVKRGGVTRAGTPVLVQLLGGQPEPLAATARTAISAGAYGIDLNFGCPAKLVNRHDGGASLLKAPERIEKIVACVRAAVPSDRPVSVKVRLGWDSHDDVTRIARAAERGGATWLTIHGRTKCEMYGPPADWVAIGSARRALGIVTVANGDLNSEGALDRCREESGCSAFMLGRGPMGRPSLLCGDATMNAGDEERYLANMLLEYLELLAAAGHTERLPVERVKQWLSLGAKVNSAVRPLFESVKRLSTVGHIRTVLLACTISMVVSVASAGCTRHPEPCSPAPVPTSAAPAATKRSPSWPPLDERFLEASAATQGFRLGRPIPLAITRDGAVLFRRTKPRDRHADLFELSPKGDIALLASAGALLSGAPEHVSDEEKARRERTRTMTAGIVDVDVSDDGSRVLIPLGGRLFLLERGTRRVREVDAGKGTPFDPHLSPDGRRVAFARDGDVFVANTDGGPPRRLVQHEEGIELGVAEFAAQEEFGRTRGHWFSPDGKFLAFQRTDARKVETAYVADPRHPQSVPVPFKYPRAGRENALVDLGIVRVAGGAPVWARWDTKRHPYVAKVIWEVGSPLSLLVLDRNQTEMELLRVDPATGATTSLHVERDAAWVDLVPGSPSFFPDGSGFLWAALRENGYSLERYDSTGTHRSTVLPAEFGLRQIRSIEPGATSAIIQGGSDPRVEHVFRISLGGEAPVALTAGGGVHQAEADHGVTVITSAAAASGTTVTAVFRDGTRVPIPSEAEAPPLEPTTVIESVELPGRTLYAAITRPRAFDPHRRYPVLVKVYGGPGAKTVVDARDRYLLDQWYADAGFIVVRTDGRGTPDRGRDFERVLLRDFVTVPLEDQVSALAALQVRHPEMDPGRTGIFGWSFGGYLSIMAVLLRPDVFEAAVAGAPATDWELYDTAYTERYLKLPADDPDGYRRSSALTYADRLTRPLLIMHGVTDDNVHFAHTLAFIEALYAAGKRAEVITLSSTHMVPEPRLVYLREKAQVDFFRRHLSD